MKSITNTQQAIDSLAEALEFLNGAGKGIAISVLDSSKQYYTRDEILQRWGKKKSWFYNLLEDKECKLVIHKKGGRGRGNTQLYKAYSVLQEEQRLKSLMVI